MPRVLPCDPRAPDREALAEAARILLAGGLVAFPTETVYGLGALATDARALARVFEAKGRPTHHPLIAHVADEAQARGLAAGWPAAASALARAFWPGPLTLVVERASHIPAAIAGGSSSVAVRVPSHPVAQALLALVGVPVAAPSANRYQGLSPTTAAHVVKELGDRVDLVLDGGGCDAGIESTVVDVRVDPPLVLRPGAVRLAAIAALVPGIASPSGGPRADQARASPGMDARHYAPRAPLTLAATRDAAVAVARSLAATEGARVGLVLHGSTRSPDAPDPALRAALLGDGRLVVRLLPGDASAYARELYGTLHDLDDAQVGAIVVQAVPTDASWWAVADRLARGSTPRS